MGARPPIQRCSPGAPDACEEPGTLLHSRKHARPPLLWLQLCSPVYQRGGCCLCASGMPGEGCRTAHSFGMRTVSIMQGGARVQVGGIAGSYLLGPARWNESAAAAGWAGTSANGRSTRMLRFKRQAGAHAQRLPSAPSPASEQPGGRSLCVAASEAWASGGNAAKTCQLSTRPLLRRHAST